MICFYRDDKKAFSILMYKFSTMTEKTWKSHLLIKIAFPLKR